MRVKSLSTTGRGELKNFRTRGRLPIWGAGGGGTFAGGSVPHYMQYNFHLPNDPFHRAKSKNNFYSGYSDTTMRHMWSQHGPFAPNKFFWKIIIILIYVLTHFIVQNLKKLFQADLQLWGCEILVSKKSHFTKWELFQKTC